MMFGQNRRIQLPLAGALLLCALVGVYLFMAKRSSKPAARISKHKVETPADEALKYWTVDKMRQAKPAPMPKVGTPNKGKKQPGRPPRTSQPPRAE